MTPLERMQSMQPYHNSYEGTPAHLQDKAKQLCWEYNQTSPQEEERRRAIVTVCGGVTIGEGSIIGAGSTVTKDIPAGVIAAGVPCKVLRPITEADKLKPEEISF